MNRWLHLKPRSPLLIGRLKADSAYLVTLPYIPGRVVRGAWAEGRRMAGKAATIAAAARQLQIWNFHPVREGMVYSLPFPKSAWTCKRHPGFRPHGHGVLDSCIPRWVYRLLEEQARLPVPFQIVCDICEDRMTPTDGYYGIDAAGGRARISIPLQFQTKVALSRRRRAAMEGMLYQVTAIAPQEDLAFVGRVQGPPDLIREVEEALEQVGVGALTRRGYGQVQVCRGDPPAYLSLRERVERFNRISGRSMRISPAWRRGRRRCPKGRGSSPSTCSPRGSSGRIPWARRRCGRPWSWEGEPCAPASGSPDRPWWGGGPPRGGCPSP
jgi:CRISPR-associated protein Csx10